MPYLILAKKGINIEHKTNAIKTNRAITTAGFVKNLFTISNASFLGFPAIDVKFCLLDWATKSNLSWSSWLILYFLLNSLGVNLVISINLFNSYICICKNGISN